MPKLSSRPAELRLSNLRVAIRAVVGFYGAAARVALGVPTARARVRMWPAVPIPSDTPPLVASSTLIRASSTLLASGA